MILAFGRGASAGLLGFLVVVCLIVACFFLFRSMNRRIRRVQERELAARREVSPDGEASPSPAVPPARRRSTLADKKAWQEKHTAGPDGTVRRD